MTGSWLRLWPAQQAEARPLLNLMGAGVVDEGGAGEAAATANQNRRPSLCLTMTGFLTRFRPLKLQTEVGTALPAQQTKLVAET